MWESIRGMDKSYLDQYSPAYEEEFQYALDNRLIINWYPHRILKSAKGDGFVF